ncbi:Minor extracellular protease vpr [Verticillium dahliae VDG2]|nr:Minor extracellular protease vpr [Verticillium dahliae VDG2]
MIRGFRPRVAILAAVAILFSLILVLLVLQDRETGYLYALVPPDLGSQRQHGNDWAGADANGNTDTDDVNTTHPIDELIEEAQLRHRQLLGKQSLTLRQAASRYRERRGRHPPPGFDVWFAAAMASKAVIVEEFFDRIHHDINPFWAVDPAEMRRHAARQAFMIRVRGGKTATDTEGEEPPYRGPLRKKICTMVEPYYAVADELPMKKMYNHKYLPDIDGNSFSGRYRAFLLSSSMPLKSTIYAEWHDDRLVPWVHFVPFDNTYVDLYGIMDYFLRGRDAAAERIATDGKRWAETVLRREDMRLYVWRLLLEYARVMDDNRDRLAFVQDWID